jgi:hypothetical protein
MDWDFDAAAHEKMLVIDNAGIRRQLATFEPLAFRDIVII